MSAVINEETNKNIEIDHGKSDIKGSINWYLTNWH